jgi:hypothetical protein
MHPNWTDIGVFLKTVVSAWNIALGAAAKQDGAGVAQLVGPGFEYQGAQMVLYVGAATGSPTGISVVATLQDSADNITFAPVVGAPTVTVGAANTQGSANINLRSCRQYLRVSIQNALAGGTAPTTAVAGILIMGGSSENPAI